MRQSSRPARKHTSAARVSTLIRRLLAARSPQPAGAPAVQLEDLEPRLLLSVGGGYTGGGITGQYFNNTSLSGTATFTRTDVRVDFNWGATQAPGGSDGAPFNQIGTSNYSVAWTGKLIPSFSETYTFNTAIDSADGVRLSIRPDGNGPWTQIINDWSTPSATSESATYALTAGQTYDVQLQYYHTTGAAEMQLHWSSPSTPNEPIEAASVAGINAVTYDATTYADAMKMGRNEWTDPTTGIGVARDANGWPMADALNVVWEGAAASDVAGTYLLQFNGEAQVSAFDGGAAIFTVGSQTYTNVLPLGAGYNPATNTTTATMALTSGNSGVMTMIFQKTQRTATSPSDTGLTNIQLMRPTSPGASTYYAPGTIFDTALEQTYSAFTTERWLTANFDTTQTNWSDRVRPSYAEANFADRDEIWEYEVMLANETGKDLYITIPVNASPAYVTDLANLIKYGSDGTNPYTGYVANPVYPGLNSNLRLYVEWGNEDWNYGFTQAYAEALTSEQAIAANTTEGQIVDYDGQAGSANFTGNNRWTALKTVETSNTFRAIWGDSAMGNQVRIVLEYQYDDNLGTATTELNFINDYFNNADGVQHVANPHPVSYYIWGGGGAVYFWTPDDPGYQGSILVTNASFESAHSGWNFTGNAGTYTGSPSNIGSPPGAPDGSQAAYIGNTGSISTTINFSATGVFAIDLFAANENGNNGAIRLYLDGQEITPNGCSYIAYNGPWTPGTNAPGDNPNAYGEYGSAPFTISTTGNHTLTIVGAGPTGSYTYIDNVRITSADAIFAAGITGSSVNGSPTGAAADAAYAAELSDQAKYAESFGLHDVAYEGGWAVSGSTNISPLDDYCKYVDPRSGADTIMSLTDFQQAGGALYTFGTFWSWFVSPVDDYSGYWPGDNSAGYTIPAAIAADSQSLPAAPTNGFAVPATLSPAEPTWSGNVNGVSLRASGFFSWNILVPVTGAYNLALTTGTGGNLQFSVDGSSILFTGPSGGLHTSIVTLTAGLHSIMVLSTSGLVPVTSLVVSLNSGATGASAPTVATPAAATVTPTTANLSVLGADASGESNLTYVWSTLGSPPAPVTFSANGSNAAKNTTATFSQAGTYNFQVLITDIYGLSTTSTVSVTINQVLTGLHISPSSAPMAPGASQQFTVATVDQFAVAMPNQPAITWSVAPGGAGGTINTSGLYTAPSKTGSDTVTATGGGLSASASVSVQVFTNTLTANTDIGAPGLAGSSSYANGVYTVTGGGSDIYGASDQFQFDYAQLTGDGSITARVLSQQNTDGYAKSGIMFRDSTNPSAMFIDLMITPSNGVALEWRTATGAQAMHFGVNGGLTAPIWLKLTRSGNTFTAYIATTPGMPGASDWVQIGIPETVAMSASADVGLAVTAHNNSLLCTSTFSGLSLQGATTTSAPQPPTIATGAAAVANLTSAGLSVLGADANGESTLTYSWAITGTPPAPVTFSANNTNAAKNTTATFTKAGTYNFLVTITDQNALTITSAVSITINQTLTSITISPASPSITGGTTQQFAATGLDQFGNALTTQPSFTWSVLPAGAGGSINSSGLYSAPNAGGNDTVKAASASISATTSLSITPANGDVTTGMTGHWSFNGSLTDSVAGNTATFSGASPAYTTDQNGAQALKFNGASSQSATLPYSANDSAQTISMWVNPTSIAAQNLIVRTNSAGPTSQWSNELRINSNGQFELYVWDGSAHTITAPAVITPGQWYLVTATITNNGQMILYVNGVQQGAAQNIATTWSGGDRYIIAAAAAGSYGYAPEGFFTGSIDDVRIYNTALTAAQVAAVYNANKAPTPPTIATGAGATANLTSASLSVLGADANGESTLTYSWSITGTPPAAVSFSANNTNAAKNTIATFTKAGIYNFLVTITDQNALTITSAVSITINQTLTSITISPASPSITGGTTQQFAATGLDQFGNALTTQPSFTWSVLPGGAGGSINSSGLYSAPVAGGTDTIKAASASISATTSVTVASADVTTGMTGHWSFNGSLTDSVAGNAATFSGASPAYTTDQNGAQALKFNGASSQSATLPYSANDSAQTISMWVNPTSIAAQNLIVRTNSAGPTSQWSNELRINSNGQFELYVWDGSAHTITAPAVITPGQWYLVTATITNNGQMILYVNGVQQGAQNIATTWSGGDRYIIAAAAAGSYGYAPEGFFTGSIDDVRIYNTALTPVQIASIYTATEG